MGILSQLEPGRDKKLEEKKKMKYSKIALQDRKRIFKAYEDGEDWKRVCKTVGVKENTAYRWLAAGNRNPRRKEDLFRRRLPK